MKKPLRLFALALCAVLLFLLPGCTLPKATSSSFITATDFYNAYKKELKATAQLLEDCGYDSITVVGDQMTYDGITQTLADDAVATLMSTGKLTSITLRTSPTEVVTVAFTFGEEREKDTQYMLYYSSDKAMYWDGSDTELVKKHGAYYWIQDASPNDPWYYTHRITKHWFYGEMHHGTTTDPDTTTTTAVDTAA